MPLIHISLRKVAYRSAKQPIRLKSTRRRIHRPVPTRTDFLKYEPRCLLRQSGRRQIQSSYYFHWADYNNEPIWAKPQQRQIGFVHQQVLPALRGCCHWRIQLIGFYTIADSADGCLKVLRSYQYITANASISDVVRKCDWEQRPTSPGRPGGYVWHYRFRKNHDPASNRHNSWPIRMTPIKSCFSWTASG